MTELNSAQEDELVVDGEEEDDEVAVTFDIASYPSDLTLNVIHDMWHAEDIVIPTFQRNFVWTIKQASLLIESFLMGLPVPQIFFYIDGVNKNQVIDGQQRLMSIVQFFDGYFGSESIQGKKQVFRLQGLNNKSPFAKKRFSDLEDSHQRKLKSAVLRAINIRQLSPQGESTSIYHIFERLNTGGTPLQPQEIRNCVFRGPFAELLCDLNKDEAWRQIIGKKNYDRHQKDVELILRIFALSFYFDKYEKPMKEFLNQVMNKEKTATSETVKTFSTSFRSMTKEIVSSLGICPFHLRGPLNSSAMDAVFAALLNHRGKVPNDLGKRYESLKEDKKFVDTTSYSTSDLSVVKDRFEVTKKYLLGKA